MYVIRKIILFVNILNSKLIEKLFDFYVHKKIKNPFLVHYFYFVFTIYQYLDILFSPDKEFKDERNHYIPRFILNGFSIPSNKGQIYQYERGGIPPSSGISIKKEAATIVNYYATAKLGGKISNVIEKRIFADLVEKFGSRIFNKINTELSPLEENILATHAAFQYVRTPVFELQAKLFILYLIEIKKVNMSIFTNSGKDELQKIASNNTLNICRSDLLLYFRSFNPSSLDISKKLSTYLENSRVVTRWVSVWIGVGIIESIFRKNISIIESHSKYFILPDSGVVVIDRKDPSWPYGWDFSDSSMMLFLPFSPTRCLCFSSLKPDDFLRGLFVELVISASYSQCLRFVYSDRKDSNIQAELNK
jgi:hypothetical protein